MPPLPMHPLLVAREQSIGAQDAQVFCRELHFPTHFASKLNVEHTLEGHGGCVNRLAWNADGSRLISGSDDRRAIIWHYPDVRRTPIALTTEHRANIFGCHFLPGTGDRRVVTGAMDDTVQLHELDASPAAHSASAAAAAARGGRVGTVGGPPMHRRATAAQLQLVMPRTKVYLSHKDRVKDVEVEPDNPHNFWSAGEDGIVRQYDTRAPNQDKWESPTVLVQVHDGARTVQVKGLDICRSRPQLLALACGDPHVRVYDRRKLSPGCWRRRGATPHLLALAPPHLPLAAQARYGKSHATYVSFSNRGDKIVTTYHGDHAYSFDITSAGEMAAVFPQPQQPDGSGGSGGASGGGGPGSSGLDGAPQQRDFPEHQGSRSPGASAPLPPRAEAAKARGNTAMFERHWSAAVEAFTQALHLAPGAPVLYALRAEALLGRGWVGDAALALRDCDTACCLDESYSRAFLRRIQALQALQQYQCALAAVSEYRRRFPGRAAADVETLASQLRASLEERRRVYEARRQQQERRRVQRAEALARAPRRTASAAARPGGGGGSAGASAAPTAAAPATPTTPVPAAATAAATAPVSAPPAADAIAEATGRVVAAASTSTAAAITITGASAAAGCNGAGDMGPGSRAPGAVADADGDVDMAGREGSPSDSDEIYGPPPPPPPLPPPDACENRTAVTWTPSAAAAAGAPLGQGQGQGQGHGQGGLPPSTPRRQAPRDAEESGGLAGVWEEDGEGDAGDGDGAAAAREAELQSDGGGNSDDDWSPAEGEDERDPDLELFLQYYAQAVELAGDEGAGPSTSGASDRPAGHWPHTTPPRDGGPPAAPHLRGAWAGSAGGRRMLQRYVGQCNVQTDIKEVGFIGCDDRLVAAGSDCGRVFLYDAESGAVLRALAADEDVANCVQCHPTLPVLASSGIENVVRLWAPTDSAPSAAAAAELQEELGRVVERNQERMKEGPSYLRTSALQQALHDNPQLWHLLMSQLYGRGVAAGRGPAGTGGAGSGSGGGEEEEDEEDEEGRAEVSCRMA